MSKDHMTTLTVCPVDPDPRLESKEPEAEQHPRMTIVPAPCNASPELLDAVDRYMKDVEAATGALRDRAVDLGLECTSATRCAVCLQHKTTPLYNVELGGYICLACIDSKLIETQERVGLLTRALKELLIFAGHYAKLLNMHDGGARRVSVYEDIDAWLETLAETGALDRT